MPNFAQRSGTPGPSGADAVGSTTTRGVPSTRSSNIASTGAIGGRNSPAPTSARVPGVGTPIIYSFNKVLFVMSSSTILRYKGCLMSRCRINTYYLLTHSDILPILKPGQSIVVHSGP